MKFKKTLKSFNKFVEYASKNILWVFGWTVFAASLSFTIRYFVDYPNQLAIRDSNSARFNTYTQDYDESLQVTQILLESSSTFIQIIEDYNLIVGKINNQENISIDLINNSISNAKAASVALASSNGTLEGVFFNDDKLDQYVDSFSSSIQKKRDVVSVILEFYQGILSGDQDAINQSIDFMQEYSIDVYRQEAEALETLNNFRDEFDNFHAENMIEINKETNKGVLYSYKSNLVFVALIYIFIFLIVSIISWRKSQKKSKRKRKKESKKRKKRNGDDERPNPASS